VFFYVIKLLFSGFLPFKGNFVCGQNNSKYRDLTPLSILHITENLNLFQVYFKDNGPNQLASCVTIRPFIHDFA